MKTFPARNYEITEGRWLTPDPAGLAAVDLTNPQSWNRYAYVGNNPLAFTDPTGMIRQGGGGGGVNGGPFGYYGVGSPCSAYPAYMPLSIQPDYWSGPGQWDCDQDVNYSERPGITGGGGTGPVPKPTPNPPPAAPPTVPAPAPGDPTKSGKTSNAQQFTCPGDFSYYGNWGGPGWSGGQTAPLESLTSQQQALAPPIDGKRLTNPC